MAIILTQEYHGESFDGNGDIVDITFPTTGAFTGITVTGGTFVLAGFINNISISAADECFFPTVNNVGTTADLPTNADPPFPPVWPYLFSTGAIYGRDHLSTNIKMIRGDTYSFELGVILNGDVVNISAATLTMTAKWDVGDADLAAVFTRSSATGGIEITDGPNGLAVVTIAHSNTSGLPAHVVNLVYDIQMLDASSNVYTILTGTLSVYPDVTITT